METALVLYVEAAFVTVSVASERPRAHACGVAMGVQTDATVTPSRRFRHKQSQRTMPVTHLFPQFLRHPIPTCI